MNLKITTANGTQYSPKYRRTEISRDTPISTTNLIDFDGEYLDKRKNGNRTHSFVIIFDDHRTAAQFEDDTKDVRPISFFDPIYNIDFKAHIISLGWAHEFTDNIDGTTFNITLHETTSLPVYQELNKLPTLAQFNRKHDRVRLNSKFRRFFSAICAAIDRAVSFMFRTLTRGLSKALNVLGDIERMRLRLENIRRSPIDAFRQAVELLKIVALLPMRWAGALPRNQLRPFMRGMSDLISQSSNLRSGDLGNDLYYACVSPFIYCKCSIANDLRAQEETREFLAQIQDDLYSDYAEINDIVSGDTAATADKEDTLANESVMYLTTSIKFIEENLLSALQERQISYDTDRDIYPLVSELYPCTTPEEYETALWRFVVDNNLHAERLFYIPKNTRVKYFV